MHRGAAAATKLCLLPVTVQYERFAFAPSALPSHACMQAASMQSNPTEQKSASQPRFVLIFAPKEHALSHGFDSKPSFSFTPSHPIGVVIPYSTVRSLSTAGPCLLRLTLVSSVQFQSPGWMLGRSQTKVPSRNRAPNHIFDPLCFGCRSPSLISPQLALL